MVLFGAADRIIVANGTQCAGWNDGATLQLFGDNELIGTAISGAVSISESGGVIIYTGQPWHPQLKMIAFVLNSYQKKDWIMRRRSQRELDSVFSYHGVTKQAMKIDNFGIFTVSWGKT